ncbi:MAG: hypothetical protein DI544_11355 [Sphingomonas taxi]|uniref:Uncharacterized protein n=1 Tax=Sphingomonas taxi TaxID=1549858 RepID=A0A2W5R8P5_9SPHN|nr:MAG: hypothetical protein DI544_11355 [Sphingomonas taxi]
MLARQMRLVHVDLNGARGSGAAGVRNGREYARRDRRDGVARRGSASGRELAGDRTTRANRRSPSLPAPLPPAW